MPGITDKIRTILKSLEIKEPPIPLEKVANFFTIKVVPYKNFPENISGTIVNEDGFIAIGINSNKPITRQRFTIAHELGHFLLNHDIGSKLIDENFDKPINIEMEANDFAAELLMPRDFLKKDIEEKKFNINIPDLAKRYNVSEQAMSVRLLRTGLINKL
ncbi:MAG: ImmA/IrrE family metallo-endopeptidase [Candidatus Parcubacteria bacterium]|nr:ImmA/IrrE family metallo-endopeptidase [Candidatus Parcubacteria bacterium]